MLIKNPIISTKYITIISAPPQSPHTHHAQLSYRRIFRTPFLDRGSNNDAGKGNRSGNAAISAAALIVGLSRLGLEARLVRYLPDSKNKNGLHSTIVMITLILALVLTVVFMLGINIFSLALSFIRDGWFLPVFFAYIAVASLNSVQNIAFISIRRADLSLIQNLLPGIKITILCS